MQTNEPFHKDCLLDKNSKLPIENMTGRTVSQKLDYAWEVYNSKGNEFEDAHKKGALTYLKKTFKINTQFPRKLRNEEIERIIQTLMERKKDDYIPEYPKDYYKKNEPNDTPPVTKGADKLPDEPNPAPVKQKPPPTNNSVQQTNGDLTHTHEKGNFQTDEAPLTTVVPATQKTPPTNNSVQQTKDVLSRTEKINFQKGDIPQIETVNQAWAVFNSQDKNYSDEVEMNAFNYLKWAFNFPPLEAEKDIKAYIPRLIQEMKTSSVIPNFSKRISLTQLSTINASSSGQTEKIQPFIEDANKSIEEINALIQQYNKSTGQNDRLEKLREIDKIRRKMNNQCSESQILNCPQYYDIVEKQLFTQLQQQFSINGITSMRRILPSSSQSPVLPSEILPELIANMAPEKLQALFKILWNSAYYYYYSRNLGQLYSREEPGYNAFQNFINTHTITRLSVGNSINYKITPRDGGAPFILKVEYRLDNPRDAEATLREVDSLKNTFTAVTAERIVYGNVTIETELGSNEQPRTRSIIVTEFCSGSDVGSFAATITNDDKKIESALTIYQQMGTILEHIRENDCAFPDMKNTNWLLDSKQKLRIADAKALIHAPSDTIIREKIMLISTEYINPIEIKKKLPKFSTDKMHAFMLGKNLYQYMTGCDWKYLEKKDDAIDFDFDKNVFRTPAGKLFAELIGKSVQQWPHDRLSIKDVLKRLELISYLSPAQWDNLKTQIRGSTIPLEQKNEYLQKIDRFTTSIKNGPSFGVIEKELANLGLGEIKINIELAAHQQKLSSLQDGKEKEKEQMTVQRLNILLPIISAIGDLRRRSHEWFSIGMNAKADNIEAAMKMFEQELQNNPSQYTKSKAYQNLLEAMATHRHFGKSGNLYKTAAQEIDESKAANTYAHFKMKLNDIRSKESVPEPSQTPTENNKGPER